MTFFWLPRQAEPRLGTVAGAFDKREKRAYLTSRKAQVVELVDTLDSGSSAGNSMEVRVLSWALAHLSSH